MMMSDGKGECHSEAVSGCSFMGDDLGVTCSKDNTIKVSYEW